MKSLLILQSMENQTFVVQIVINMMNFFILVWEKKLIEKDPWMVYCGVFEDGDKIRAINLFRRSSCK